MSAQTPPTAFQHLEGTWYVHLSNFSMWLKGNKHNPRFTYTLQTRKRVTGLKDVVSYEKGEKQRLKEIIGFDSPQNNNATQFTWRGKGLLSLVKSKWEIIYQEPSWTLIHFEKTLFTAEGYDVISRQKHLGDEVMQAVRAKLKELGIKDTLQLIRQE